MANDESRAALEQITSSDVESDSEPEVSATTDSRTSLAEDAVSSTDTHHSDMVTEQSPFLEAVVVAREAIAVGQSANTAQDWLQLADQWQRASELMSRVAEEDENYAIAQRCEELYRNNSDYARNRGLA
jgi:predicted phage gp36 major capsid-like protein